jgi:hypothetical protein
MFTETVEWMRLESEEDYTVYAGKIEAASGQVQEAVVALREGMRRGWVQSAAVVYRVEEQVRCHYYDDADDSISKVYLKNHAMKLHNLSLQYDADKSCHASSSRSLACPTFETPLPSSCLHPLPCRDSDNSIHVNTGSLPTFFQGWLFIVISRTFSRVFNCNHTPALI